MRLGTSRLRAGRDMQFNMTAIIDVVFLLIIFFMLVCQFISQENYPVALPDDCPNALVPDHLDRNAVTVSVFAREQAALYAVRARVFDPAAADYHGDQRRLLTDMSAEIRQEVTRREGALVHLRADRDLRYGQVQDALRALAQAGVTQVQLAAFRSPQAPPAEDLAAVLQP